ncbi:glutaredoxin [Roseateles asaccharophilus]|uniref:Methylamine utilization protein MauE n=1 Tax=Roseateles asaccharophilus TaxID=582607 RepID=A0ABU2AG66_9BURK|nr:glutaredoxin [Roseateles asaccharophilus]MDR7334923.1 glutaredoxin [Roseateles asaccharophilus]
MARESTELTAAGQERRAVLYRMVMPDHICPYGLKSLDLLKRNGFDVEDHHLTSKAETETFKKQHGVETTPQTFIDGTRVGGNDDLRAWLGLEVHRKGEVTYTPVAMLFGMAAAMALAVGWGGFASTSIPSTVERFAAIAMCLLAVQKLRDVESFSTMFLNYDLLARRWVRYAYLYPFAEGAAGLLMLAGTAMWLSVPLASFIGLVGAASVIKAVYVDKRSLKCACVGGDSQVPLGPVSLAENLMMVAMAVWMAIKAWA